MSINDPVAWAKSVAELVKGYVRSSFDQFLSRFDELENKIQSIPAGAQGEPGLQGEPGNDGRNAYEVAVSLGFQGSVNDWMDTFRGQKGEDGKSVTPDELLPHVKDWLDKYCVNWASSIPVPENGKDGAPGENGASVTVDDVLPTIKSWFDAIPRPVDGKDGTHGEHGKSVTVEDVLPMLEQRLDHKHAEWALDFERRAQALFQNAIDRMPVPKDGKDGRDAMSVEDFELAQSDDERTLTVALVCGDKRVEKNARMSHPLHRGVYQAGSSYLKGDCVSYGGSTWSATRDTDSKPETDDSWRLIVKRGRDGKQGEPGLPGRDFTPPKPDKGRI